MKNQLTTFLALVITGVFIFPAAFSQTEVKPQKKELSKEHKELETYLRETKEKRAVAERTAGSNFIYKSKESDGGVYTISSGDGFFFTGNSGFQSSQLSLSKRFEGESIKNDGTFDVDEKVNHINITIGGSVKEGKIILKIVLPNKEVLKEMTIDNTADIQFTQRFRITSGETKYAGKWKYEIEAVKAMGNYKLMIQTN